MVFTSSWSTISSAQTDADSPLDVTLMEGMRQNELHLYEWLGQGYTPSTAHNHNGVNSAIVILGANSVNSSAIVAGAVNSAAIAANAVTSTKIGTTAVELSHLKFTQGGYSQASSGVADISISRYAHWPRLFKSAGSSAYIVSAICQYGGVSTGVQVDNIRFEVIGVSTGAVYWDYHSS